MHIHLEHTGVCAYPPSSVVLKVTFSNVLVCCPVQVNKQQVEMDTKFGAVHRAVLMLDKFEYPISPTIRNRFNSAPQRLVCRVKSIT